MNWKKNISVAAHIEEGMPSPVREARKTVTARVPLRSRKRVFRRGVIAICRAYPEMEDKTARESPMWVEHHGGSA